MDAIKRISLILFFVAFGILSRSQVYVNTATQLQTALNNAVAGQTIYIQDGYYQRSGGFYANAGIDGTAANPITVIGSRNAVLSTGTLNSSYGFSLKGNKHWIIKGFTVTNSSKGVVLDNSNYVTLDSLSVTQIGGEAIHLRTFTSYCTIKNCYIDSTGLNDYSFGEGIYIGSANGNWCTYTNCDPDTSNYNQVLNNNFGNFVTAENVDIKEGTKGGLIKGNNFNGTGLQNMNGGDSWIDVKGNYYSIEDNVGNNSILDGFQTHIQPPGGFGNFNTFRNNVLNVNATGYGINVKTSSTNGTALNNIVCNNNTVSGAGSGLTNISTTTCSTVFPLILLNWNVVTNDKKIICSWEVTSTTNIEGFRIEQSTDGKEFSTLKQELVSGKSYNIAFDEASGSGKYFRLVVILKDRTILSKIIQLQAKSSSYKLRIEKNQLVIHYPATTGLLHLYTQLGQSLGKCELKQGYNYFQLNYAANMYVVSIYNNEDHSNISELIARH